MIASSPQVEAELDSFSSIHDASELVSPKVFICRRHERVQEITDARSCRYALVIRYTPKGRKAFSGIALTPQERLHGGLLRSAEHESTVLEFHAFGWECVSCLICITLATC